MIDKAFAVDFATDWIASWNDHDLDRILAHYSDDFEMNSPYIITLINEPSGTLRGKEAVRSYWIKALNLLPNLHFELIETLAGVNSVTLFYKSVRGPSIEVFHFNPDGKVARAYAHYPIGD
jgi:hypothetical protein